MDLYSYFLFWVCILGLCLGSFYNVVILRSLSNESIVFPPSKCPKCGHKLFFWHNIPVLSYILLRGKCYFCKEKISIQYPIIEIITMILFVATFIKFDISIKTPFVIFWLSCLLIMTMTDLKAKLVDCNIAIIMAVSGFIYNICVNGFIIGSVHSLCGMIAGAGLIALIAFVFGKIIKTDTMGEADYYVFGAVGAIFGYKAIFLILFFGLIISMIFVLPLFLYERYKNKDKASLLAFLLFVLSIIYYIKMHTTAGYIFILASGIFAAIASVKNINKAQNTGFMQIPFVPTFAFGVLIYLFYIGI